MRLLLPLALLLVLSACRDERPRLGGTRADFRLEPTALDFGRVLEGERAALRVRAVSLGRSGLTLQLRTEGPFEAPASVDLPAGGAAEVELTFLAGSTHAEGRLVASAEGAQVDARLEGTGVRPLPCDAGPCRTASFDLQSGTCVEAPAADDTACIPSSRCEEAGRCRAGACVGRPRTCDDLDPCTDDACAPTEGCITTPATCPPATQPCKVGVCRPGKGCGEADVADWTPCGPEACRDVCRAGTCVRAEAPDGTLCSPPTLCQDPGRCARGACVRPDAGDLPRAFSQALPGAPVAAPDGPALLLAGSALYTSLCPPDGDGGCALASYTANGFQRFLAPYPEDGGVRTLLAGASDGGVLLRADDGALERYGADGARAWRTEAPPDAGPTGPGRVALAHDGTLWALHAGEDAGVLVQHAPDGGVHARLAVPADTARVALQEDGTPLLCAPGAPLWRVAQDADGGSATLEALGAPLPAGDALALAGGRVWAGARVLLDAQDGGARVDIDWGALSPVSEPALLAGPEALAFARAPDGGALVLRAFDVQDGGLRWEAQVGDAGTRLVEAAALATGPILTLTEEADGRAWLGLWGAPGLLARCALPGQPRLAGVALGRASAWVAAERDGGWVLEGYPLGLDVAGTGWPQRHGAGGARQAR